MTSGRVKMSSDEEESSRQWHFRANSFSPETKESKRQKILRRCDTFTSDRYRDAAHLLTFNYLLIFYYFHWSRMSFIHPSINPLICLFPQSFLLIFVFYPPEQHFVYPGSSRDSALLSSHWYIHPLSSCFIPPGVTQVCWCPSPAHLQ